MKKFFTLIELIVVIAVLGILAAIIIPNISSFQEEANTTAIKSNVRNLQTGVDMYSLDNYGNVPTYGVPTEYEPKPINFDEMIPEYSRDLPETEGVKYWVDGWGKVWASTVDAPENVNLTSTTLTWDTVPEADMYKVYKVLNPTNSASLLNANTKLVFYKEASKSENTGITVDDENVKYAVSAVDNDKFESAPAGSNYQGVEYYINSLIPEIKNVSENHTQNSVSFSWENPSFEGFQKVNIYRDNVLVGDSTGGTFSENGLSQGTNYNYILKVVNGNGEESNGKNIPIKTSTVQTGWLMNNKLMTVQTTVTATPTGTTDRLTDGSNSTGYYLGVNGSSNYSLFYTFDNPVNMTYYKLKGDYPAGWYHLFFYNSEGQYIKHLDFDSGSPTLQYSGGTYPLTLNDVKYVRIHNGNSSVRYNVHELNIYGTQIVD